MNNKIICSGALFFTLDTNRFLFLHRSQGKRAKLWGLVGGTTEYAETPWEGLQREIAEEIGDYPTILKTLPLESFVSPDEHFCFHTYVCVVKHEFIPVLNCEHDGYAWCSYDKWPKPLHNGLKNTLQSVINVKKLNTIFQNINFIDT